MTVVERPGLCDDARSHHAAARKPGWAPSLCQWDCVPVCTPAPKCTHLRVYATATAILAAELELWCVSESHCQWAAAGAGRCSCRPRCQCGCQCGLLHFGVCTAGGVGSNSDYFQARGKLGWHAAIPPPPGSLSAGDCFHVVRRVRSHGPGCLLVSRCKGSRFAARGGCARSGACTQGVWHLLEIRGYAPTLSQEESFEKSSGLYVFS